MRFLTECEWEGGGEGTIALWDNLDAFETEAVVTNDAVVTSDAVVTTDAVITRDAVVTSDAVVTTEQGEQTDEDDGDEWQIDGIGQPRPRVLQRPHIGSGGTR